MGKRIFAALILSLLLLAVAATQASALLAKATDVTYNLSYGPAELQAMDAYPATAASSPLVILVHGGGWRANKRKQFSSYAEGLWRRGNAVFNIDYRLDSKTVGAFPMQVEDVVAAERYAVAHALTYNADPNNVVFVGGSAGGQLVAMAAEQLANEGTPVDGVVTLSGPFDLPPLLEEAEEGELPEEFSISLPQALGCSLLTTCKSPEAVAWAARWSPLEQLKSCSGAWDIFNSEKEVIPLYQPDEMTAALRSKGCDVTETIEPSGHSFAYWLWISRQIFAFIAAH
jgi:pimeloyl-ACP methyl ester carboxylesterase